MSQDATPVPTRPDSLILRIDADERYKPLATFSGRIAVLLREAAVQADPYVKDPLDDLLGAIYSLILATHHHFDDRLDREKESKPPLTRAEEVQQGHVRLDGKWIAGWHFNSAQYRVAAVYHRLLKLVAGHPKAKDVYPKDLLPDVEKLFRSWTDADWVNRNVKAVYREVNTLKHTTEGLYNARKVLLSQAVAAVEELLTLVEAWHAGTLRRSGRSTSP